MKDRDRRERNLDRNEDPEAIGGAVIGSTGAAMGGGIGLAALGPLGGVIGALVGAAGGWWAGKGFVTAINDVDRAENEFRRAHEHAGASRPYDEARHGYQLGYLAGRNPDYADAAFSTVETDLRTAWIEAHRQDEDAVPWEDVRAQAQTGYELARKRD